QQNIPVRYFQLDSWWYKKGEDNGVALWEPKADVFPGGLEKLHQKLSLPFVLHNRYWSAAAEYGNKFHFVKDARGGLPDDQTFWSHLLETAHRNGCVVYEQDWLNHQFHRLLELRNNVELADRWLHQMDKAAQNNQLSIQYCMALPADFLETSLLPAVTQIRASYDYSPGSDQWRIGLTSMLACALGLAPSKDTFWSTAQQDGSPYKDAFEPNCKLEALVATLSCGPVGPGDAIGKADRALLLKTCRADGLLLKPDFPAVPIDRSLLQDENLSGEIWCTSSNYAGRKWRYLLVAGQSKEAVIRAADLGITEKSIAYENSTGTISVFDNEHPLWVKRQAPSTNKVQFNYFTIAPVHDNTAFFGETSKFVTVSRQRFANISSDHRTINLAGSAGEKVELTWQWALAAPKRIDVNGQQATFHFDYKQKILTLPVVVPPTGKATIRIL
ncbi:MAG: hypothetical protein ACRD3W_14180, partial [Terriglobales bacterium]